MMKHHNKHGEEFFGTATVGERGQIVVPIKARKASGLKPGSQVFVFGMGDGMVCIASFTSLKKFASLFSKRLDIIRKVLKTPAR